MKNVNEKINELQEVVEKAIAALNSAATAEDILQNCRIPVNVAAAEAASNATFHKNNTGEWKITFSSCQPTKADILNITKLVDTYCSEEYLRMNDLGLPSWPTALITTGDSARVKTLADELLRSLGCYIDSSGIMAISAAAEIATNHRKMVGTIIIGAAVAALLTGGIATAIILHNKKQEEADDNITDDEDVIENDDDGVYDSTAVEFDDLPVGEAASIFAFAS